MRLILYQTPLHTAHEADTLPAELPRQLSCLGRIRAIKLKCSQSNLISNSKSILRSGSNKYIYISLPVPHPFYLLSSPSSSFILHLFTLHSSLPQSLTLFLSLAPSLPLSLILSLTSSLNHSFTHSLTHSLTQCFFTHSFFHSLTLSLNHYFPHSLTRSLTHSLTPSSLTHSLLPHSPTPPPFPSLSLSRHRFTK